MVNVEAELYKEYQHKFKMPNIRQAIFRALFQHGALTDIIAEFDLSFGDDWRKRLVILRELQARTYPDDRDKAILRKLVGDILDRYINLPTKAKTKADNALKRIIPLLTLEERKRIGLQLIKHRCKSHRYAGYAALSGLIDLTIITRLLENFENYRDMGALECIARSNNQYAISTHAEYIFDHLNDDYLKARVFQRLLDESPTEAIQLSRKHELAFVWGAGRAQAYVALKTILEILSRKRTDYDALGIIVWALGRLGAVDALKKLRDELEV